jgi:hypothetical protein
MDAPIGAVLVGVHAPGAHDGGVDAAMNGDTTTK